MGCVFHCSGNWPQSLTYINAGFARGPILIRKGKTMKPLLLLWLGWVTVISFTFHCSAQDWQTYKNSRFGFQLGYPSSAFRPGVEAANDDGLQFHYLDGRARILAFGGYNVLEHTPNSYLKWIKSESDRVENVTYERVTRDWIIVSGFIGPDVYYEKTIFSCSAEVMNSVVLIYSASLKPKLDPLVGPITKSLTPGVGYGTPEGCQQGR